MLAITKTDMEIQHYTESTPESEYNKYRVIQDRMYLSDFDKEVKRLKEEMGI